MTGVVIPIRTDLASTKHFIVNCDVCAFYVANVNEKRGW